MKIQPRETSFTIDAAARQFVSEMRSIGYAYPLTIDVMSKGVSKSLRDLASLLKAHASEDQIRSMIKMVETIQYDAINTESSSAAAGSGGVSITIEISDADVVTHELEQISQVLRGDKLVRRSFIFTIVSQYDAFFGNLLRALFTLRPEIVDVSEKGLTLSQLNNFESIKEARDFILEKEVESILRASHSDQINFLEKKFSIKLTKDLNIWPSFIEITERRNLFAHGNGLVSSHYLNVCAKITLTSLNR